MAPLRKLIFCFTIAFPSIIFGQQTARSTEHHTPYPIGFLEYLPPDYHSGTDDHPLIIFLHGGGQNGNGTPQDLEKVKDWGPPAIINDQGHDMCFTVDGLKQCFVVLSPQLDPNFYDWFAAVGEFLEYILDGPNGYRIDRERIYLTGLSRGGRGVYQYAASGYNIVNQLAAIVPIAAWSDNYYEGCLIAARKIPVWAFHGALDTVVPHGRGVQAFSSIKNCSDPTPNAEMIFTTYDDRYHDSWIPAYDPSNAYHTPNLYEWLLQRKRLPPDPVITAIDQTSLNSVGVYPNPAHDIISISFNEKPPADLTVAIQSITGDLVMIREYTSTIDISGLSPGIYFLEMTHDNAVVLRERFVRSKR